MKKITIYLVAAFAICLNGVGQTVADIGWDWTGTKEVAPASGTYFSGLENTIFPGTPNEVFISCGGTARLDNSDGGLYVDKRIKQYEYLEVLENQTDYIEVSLTDNSAGKKITSVKINGTSNQVYAEGVTAGVVGIVYSDKAPFDVNSGIGYTSAEMAYCRAGNAGTTLTGVPNNCKSFRIYRKVLLSTFAGVYFVDEFGTMSAGSSKNSRIGHISVTLSGGGSAISSIDNDGKIVVSNEYFDVTGKKVNEDTKGFVIVKTAYEDGSCNISKVFNK